MENFKSSFHENDHKIDRLTIETSVLNAWILKNKITNITEAKEHIKWSDCPRPWG